MTDTKSKAISVEEAAKDLEAARDSLQALMDRITSGSGTEADLDAAERHVRFCEARLEGTRRREEETYEQEKLQALADLAERTQERVEDADVQKARKTAEKALDRYLAACMAHNESLDAAIEELLSAGDLPEGYGVAMGSDGHSPTLSGRMYRRVRPIVEAASMAHEVLRRHIPHGYIDLERPY